MVNNKRTTQMNERFDKLLTGMHTITHFDIVAFLLPDVHWACLQEKCRDRMEFIHAFSRLLSSLASNSISKAATEPAAGNPTMGVSTKATR